MQLCCPPAERAAPLHALVFRDGEAVLTAALVLLGLVVLALALADRPVKRLPLSPALIYLSVGWLAGAVLGAPAPQALELHAPVLMLVLELAVLVSLLAVGLRLRVLPTFKSWRLALLLAGPGMVITIGLAAMAAFWLLDLAWPAALLLAAIMAPTDPVLASDVQIRSDQDRDVVRLAITAEGGINDGTALPAVMLALGLMGLHALGPHGARLEGSRSGIRSNDRPHRRRDRRVQAGPGAWGPNQGTP